MTHEAESNVLNQKGTRLSTNVTREFQQDTRVVAAQSAKFIEEIHPAHLVNTKEAIMNLSYDNSDELLDSFAFFRIVSCTTDEVDDMFDFLNEKMAKFYTALYAVGKPVVYGLVSYRGTTNLVVGILDTENDAALLKSIMEGLLDGVELMPYKTNFAARTDCEKEVGLISAIPSVKIKEEKQVFSLAPLMKSLNGQDYTVLLISRPLSQDSISQKCSELIQIRDQCFTLSKRNISRQQGTSRSEGNTEGRSDTITKSTSDTKSVGVAGLSTPIIPHVSASSTTSAGSSTSKNYSQTITDAFNLTDGISLDIQNGFALSLIDYADKAIERLRQGRSNGMWETVISYSADSKLTAGIIQACISGEFAKPNPVILPPTVHCFHLDEKEAEGNSLLVPEILDTEPELSQLCTVITSEELGFMCTLPDVPVPNFELKKGKTYPLITDNAVGVKVGYVCEGRRILENMPFSLTYKDLARHTFVCGITGSGKTTTVKGILKEAEMPFLVIESAKKEYRNIGLTDKKRPQIYTLGKPEINCLRFNPFYIQCGVSPQLHIDFLKDLFNASFSFYGPMPYILEKCLQNVYKQKGWNLTLGFHPYLVNTANSAKFFDADYMQKKYASAAHKYLFPTMQDLKLEIERYIKTEMDYEGEVAGNIKTAIMARLENLCSGSKGYMFNTYEYADMDALLNHNTIFELEGLADDSDKAFCVGLLIIFINEYRQISQEILDTNRPLSHILVIEEAHRLLKNVSTEKLSEDLGNPKGKAVEHFANMLAEMRSYGQGVIVAEQIPSKLAPDVIKNSSNKIIQRLVSADDQTVMANTIGLTGEEGLDLGSLKTGTALCHKEGMSLPVRVQIPKVDDIKVTDDLLYGQDIKKRLYQINVSLAKEVLADSLPLMAMKMLNTILVQDGDRVCRAVTVCRQSFRSALKKNDVALVMCENENAIYAELLYKGVLRYLLNGCYTLKEMIPDELCSDIYQLMLSPDNDKLVSVKEQLRAAYEENLEDQGCRIVAELIYKNAFESMDIIQTIKNYFFEISDEDILRIKAEWRGSD